MKKGKIIFPMDCPYDICPNVLNSWLTMSGSLVFVSSIPGWVACENCIHYSSGIYNNREVTQKAKLTGEH